MDYGVTRSPAKKFVLRIFFVPLMMPVYVILADTLDCFLLFLRHPIEFLTCKRRGKDRNGSVNLEHARDRLKRLCVWRRRREPKTMEDLLNLLSEAANTDDEKIDPSFELNSSLQSDTHHQSEVFCEE